MKKALLFLGLAMCTSFAFAQTNNYAKPQKANCGEPAYKIDLKELALENADYKASIFTKAAGDTFAVFNFENAAAMAGIVYGDNGLVAATDVVNGQALTANGCIHACARWQWIQDTDYLESSSFAATYDMLGGTWHNHTRYLKAYLADDGGFMFMSLVDLLSSGVPAAGTTARTMEMPHAYFQLPTVTNPDLAENKVVDIAFTQIYRKFYDQTYIDYQIGNNWKTRMINVDGVDASINSYSSVYVRYVMPLELGTQSDINIRFRYEGGTRSNAYGYWWGVDNVAIISGGRNRMLADAQDWAGGAYGTMPQGMTVPLSWWTNIYNGGCYTLSNIELHANHVAGDGTATEFANMTFPNIAPGEPATPTPIYFDEQGFLYIDSLQNDFYYYYYMPGAYTGGHYMDSVNDPTLGYRAMPTANTGRHRVAVTATADSNITVRWDTIAYRVVGNTNSEDENIVSGYRWGHDNGIIAAGSSYHAGYTMDNGTRYISEDEGSWDQNGYGVYVRYSTGNVIPTDIDGNPWVLRGVEIITAPEHSAGDLNGATLRPVTYIDAYEDEGWTFYTLDNGVNNVSYTLNGNNVNNYMPNGVMEAVGEDYSAVNIFFPTQPELAPNTSYHIGYQLTSSCTFSAAATTTSYVAGTNSDGNNVYYSYDSNTVSAPWRHQFWANNADVLVKDPLDQYLSFFSAHYDMFPLIRAIVGPREVLDDASVQVYCDNEEEYYINYNGETACGEVVVVPETSGPQFVIVPGGEYMILDSLFVDDVYVPLATLDDDGNDDFVAHDYSTYDTINWWGQDSVWTNLERYYWTYTFRNISGVHSIRATVHDGTNEWNPSGVDPVAPEARMILAPNPATSQVGISIKGVSGMVDCNVIDMSGRVVYSRQINAENANTIDLSNVPAGAYFVRITNDTFSKVEKLIVR